MAENDARLAEANQRIESLEDEAQRTAVAHAEGLQAAQEEVHQTQEMLASIQLTDKAEIDHLKEENQRISENLAAKYAQNSEAQAAVARQAALDAQRAQVAAASALEPSPVYTL